MRADTKAKPTWETVKARLEGFTVRGLVGLLRDLYRASPENRRFLHARLLGPQTELEGYRKRLVDAVYPEPFSRRPVRVGEAQRLIRHYERATGDQAGTLELLLVMVEAGTEQAVDLGYGEDRYFVALERALDAAVGLLAEVSDGDREAAAARLRRVAERASGVGWGYGDYVGNVVRTFGD